eukprot:m.176634 g.176634  ORF g.176634 m.176634 type:complete len:229 (+) comp9960_c1_seq7:3422-4108(+)
MATSAEGALLSSSLRSTHSLGLSRLQRLYTPAEAEATLQPALLLAQQLRAHAGSAGLEAGGPCAAVVDAICSQPQNARVAAAGLACLCALVDGLVQYPVERCRFVEELGAPAVLDAVLDAIRRHAPCAAVLRPALHIMLSANNPGALCQRGALSVVIAAMAVPGTDDAVLHAGKAVAVELACWTEDDILAGSPRGGDYKTESVFAFLSRLSHLAEPPPAAWAPLREGG